MNLRPFHYQGTIKARNAINYLNQTNPNFVVNSTQSFNAIGAAVTEGSWKSNVNKIVEFTDDRKKNINHIKNPQDAVGDITNITHPWRIPVGLYNAVLNQGFTEQHTSTNPNYIPYLQSEPIYNLVNTNENE
ncbi:hypothetical protein ACFL0U_01280 [Pseudomonadota bacterium]